MKISCLTRVTFFSHSEGANEDKKQDGRWKGWKQWQNQGYYPHQDWHAKNNVHHR